MVWDVNTPAGTESISNGDDRIRELKSDLQTGLVANDTTLGDAASFPGADPANPLYHYRGLRGTTAERPAPGDYGLYFDTDTNTMYRDNGTTWDQITLSGSTFPTGTKMLFYNNAAPPGWTTDAAIDDKFVRITDDDAGEGATTGGTWDDLAHTHTAPSHNHSMQNHTHSDGTLRAEIYYQAPDQIYLNRRSENFTADWTADLGGNSPSSTSTSVAYTTDVDGDTGTPSVSNTGIGGNSATSSTAPGHGSAEHEYANFILCEKD